MSKISFIDNGCEGTELFENVISCLGREPRTILVTDLDRPVGYLAAREALKLGIVVHTILPYIGMTGWLPKRAGKPKTRRGKPTSDPWAVNCFEEDVRTALLDEEWVPREDWAWDKAWFDLWSDALQDSNTISVATYGSQYNDTRMAVGRRVIRSVSDRLYQLNEDGTVDTEVLRDGS